MTEGTASIVPFSAPAVEHDRLGFALTLLRLARGARVSQAKIDALTADPMFSEVAQATLDSRPEARERVPMSWVNGRNGTRADAILEALRIAAPLVAETPDDPDAETAVDELIYATLADAIAQIGSMEYAWDGWIPKAAMSTLAADAGIGKTRVALSICHCWFIGTPTMPDGSPNRYPAGTRTIWIMADRNFGETAEAAQSIGLPPEAIILNTRRDSPVDLPDFDDPETIDALRAQVLAMNPAMVVVDTITYATSRNTNRAEEAKVAFEPVIKLALDTGVPVLALAHLNAGGGVLGRRIVERVRSVISLTCPDPENQPNRRKLWVSKSAMKKPDALGITFNDLAVVYDDDPPAAPDEEPKTRGPRPKQSHKMAEWLYSLLESGPQPFVAIVEAAQDVGFVQQQTESNPKPSKASLYNAKKAITALYPGCSIGEFRASTPKTSKELLHWFIEKSSTAESDCMDDGSGFQEEDSL